MKPFEDMSFQNLLDYQELLKQDALWSDISSAEFYWRRSACVAEEINKRIAEKRYNFSNYQRREIG